MALVIACLIHQVAYVENLNPFLQSYFSTARISPWFPSWIRSRSERPRPIYFLAIETTNLKLLSVNLSLALFSPFSYLLASSISSSAPRSGTRPISRKYCLTGSVDSIPSSFDSSSISRSNFSFAFSSVSISSGVTDSKTSTPSAKSF